VKEDDDDEAKSKGGNGGMGRISLFKTNDGKEMEKKRRGEYWVYIWYKLCCAGCYVTSMIDLGYTHPCLLQLHASWSSDSFFPTASRHRH
jgi:hypothetical protein